MGRTYRSTFWKYFKKNIFFQFLPFLILSIILSIICFFVVRSYTITNMKESCLSYSISMERMFEDIDNVHFKVVNNAQAKAVMQSNEYMQDNTEFLNSLRKFHELIDSAVDYSNFVKSIYVVNNNTNMIFSNLQNETIDKFFDKEWVKEYSDEMTMPTVRYINGREQKYLSFIYPVGYQGKNESAIAINIDFFALYSMFKETDNVFYILNESDDVIFGTEENNALPINKSELMKFKDKNSIKYINNKMIGLYTISNHNNKLMIYIKNSNFMRMYIMYQLVIVFYTLIILFVVYMLSKKYATYYYNNITDIIDLLSLYDAESDAIKKSDEFEFIKNNVTQLVTKNSMNEIQLSKKIIQLKQSQMSALQTQISPHFILNALNVVNLLLIEQGDLYSNALKINENIAKILTHVLANGRYIINIEEEIECTKDYLEIGRIRKNNSFTVEWNVDEALLKYRTIKFILQPIVENSVEHGFSGFRGKGKIVIEIKKRNESICFIVTDNGRGMSRERLSELNEGLIKNEFPIKKNIAILNVHQRIRLVFGEEYGVKILKSDENGTAVKMTIPSEFPEGDGKQLF